MALTLEAVQTSLSKIYDYVVPYLPMANAHGSKFIVDDQWGTFVSQGLQDEMLLMDNDELRVLPCQMMVTSPGEETRPESETDTYREADQVHSDTHHCSDKEKGDEFEGGNCHSKSKGSYGATTQFCKDAFNHTAEGCGLAISTATLITLLDASVPECPFIGNFMNLKKSHEVEVMSQVCAMLVKETGCKLVIDFGSGKGYLGNSLSLQHNIPVLGIDAMSSYTQSAEKRMYILDKQWDGLTLNAESTGQKLTKKQKKKLKAERSENAKAKSEVSNTVVVSKEENNSQEILNTTESITNKSKNGAAASKYIPVTMFVDKNTDFIKLAMDNFPALFEQPSSGANSSNCGSVDHERTDKNLTECSLTKTDKLCGAAVSGECLQPDINHQTDGCNLLLTGLHTCGNLASTTLYLFVNSPSLQTVCSVGCCYNLMEEFAPGTSKECKDATGGSFHGFPMSRYLRQRKAVLGDTARNIASQSVHRMSIKDEPLQGERFYPRALLEKIVQDTCDRDSFKWRGLRNLEKQCGSTEEYIRKAAEKLSISHVITDDLIKTYVERYADCKHKLAAFFQLRATLAPSIESLILLDRICYLLEQATVKKVYLVKLFDPVVSPRCYGIVAFK